MCHFAAADVIRPHRQLLGIGAEETVLAVDGSVVFTGNALDRTSVDSFGWDT